MRMISKMRIRCVECDTEIICSTTAQFKNDFNCPVCGGSLNENFNSVLSAAIRYNRAVMEVTEYGKLYPVEFIE